MSIVKRTWRVGGQAVLQPQTIAQAASQQGGSLDWHGKANGIYCPRGKHYGEGYFLLSTAAMQSLALNEAINVSCQHEDCTTTWHNYYALTSEVVTRGVEKPAHLLVVADKRMVLARTAVTARFNIANGASSYVVASTNAGTPYTWQEVLEQLWALLPSGIAGMVPTLANAPASTPQNLVFEGMSAWDAINQVVTAAGHVLVLDPIQDVFRFVDASATQAGLDGLKASLSLGRTLWNHQPSQLGTSRKPSQAAVTFPGSPSFSSSLHQSADLPKSVASAALPGGGGITGTARAITDTLQATPANSAARSSRASEIAAAVEGLLRPESEPWGSVYSGIVEVVPGEQITDVHWVNTGARGTRTTARFAGNQEIDWPAPSQLPEVHLFGYVLDEDMPSGSASATIYCLETSEVIAAAGTATGVVLDPLGKFTAQIRYDTGLCYRQDTKYYAILQDPGAGSSLSTQAITFRLDETLTAGASQVADATVLVSGASGIVADDTVEVFSTGDFEAWENCEGMAIKIGSAFWIVHINQYATLSEITLTDDTHSGGGSVFGTGEISEQQTITYSGWTPLTRYPHSFLPSSATIYNPNNLLGLDGDKAIVIYNDDTSHFELFKMLPAEKREIRFQLTEDTTSPYEGNLADTQYSITGAMEFTPGELPDPSQIQDPMNLVIGGRDGDDGIAEWSYDLGAWIVTSFTRRVIRLRITSANKYEISYNANSVEDAGATWEEWGGGELCEGSE